MTMTNLGGCFLRRLVAITVIVIATSAALSQTVGVVLSGGGATALAHVGFLRALEERNIPIDYIGGTSMGSVIAAMYASGYSVAEIDSVVRSREFQLMAEGALDEDWSFYFMEHERDASMATIKYSEGELITNALPTNLIDPVLMDWKFMEGFSQADAVSGGSFDSLFVPFRCIAADVAHKREVVFRNGPLNVAVRASSTYPFYLPPRRVDGNLLFDGGLYNNFPADMMYMEFMPDVILGCNVSEENIPPDEDDLFSQLESMILFREQEQHLCEHMIVVRPSLTSVGTFEFDKISEAIRGGYQATIAAMEEIEAMVDRRVTLEEKNERRAAFRQRFVPLVIEEVRIEGLDRAQRSYVRKLMGRSQGPVPVSALREPYLRIVADEKIRSVFPIATFNPETQRFGLLLDVKKERDLFVSFGGNFSSRSINTGFVGLRYNLFGKTAATLTANSYFGRFYGSIHANIRWDISTRRMPMAFEASFTQNRWDYYKSLSTFFEDVKPSFVLMNERFGNLSVTMPAGNKGRVRADMMYAYMFDEYYQTRNFLSVDTADQTDFDAAIGRITWERNTLNRPQFPSKGTFLSISVKGVSGMETTMPGSTSAVRDTVETRHEWVTARLCYQNYFFRRGTVHLGLLLQGVASTQDFFRNYISSSIAAPSFNPIPESRTYFLPQFRAHNYAAGGLMGILELGRRMDLRAEGYVFNAFGRILSDESLLPRYDYQMQEFFIGSASLVYHSPIGPVSLSANYYDQKEEPWSILFNFGYTVFNRSPRD